MLMAVEIVLVLGMLAFHAPVEFGWFSPVLREASLERARILEMLDHSEGRQLVLVRYKPDHSPFALEWVYNKADIDAAKVVWARDMGTSENEELVRYFKDHHVWLLEPDDVPPKLSPYTAPGAQCLVGPFPSGNDPVMSGGN